MVSAVSIILLAAGLLGTCTCVPFRFGTRGGTGPAIHQPPTSQAPPRYQQPAGPLSRYQQQAAGPPRGYQRQPAGPPLWYQRQPAGFCSPRERKTAFQRCIFQFGMSHHQHFELLASSAPVCRSQVFSCTEVNKLMLCLNALPVTKVSNNCWPMMTNYLTQSFRKHQIPCSFADVERKCRGRFTPLIPAYRRGGHGPAPMGQGGSYGPGAPMGQGGGNGPNARSYGPGGAPMGQQGGGYGPRSGGYGQGPPMRQGGGYGYMTLYG